MRYGHFDDARKEYVITTPKTPYPWINYLGTERFFGLVSHQAAGYCFYRDARLRRLTRFRYNNVPTDSGGRYFYVREADGDYWSPGFLPVKRELDAFECRHGIGYTRISGKRKGLSVEELFFIPLDRECEVHQVTLKNEGSSARKVTLFSFVEFCLWNAQDDQTNYQRNLNTGEVEVDGSTIYHKTEYRERRNHFAFYHVNAPVVGFDTDRATFLGLYNGFHEPEAVQEGKSRNSVASGWSPIASHSLDVSLAPGESKTFVFVLGYIENPNEEKWEKPGVINKTRAKALIAEFSTPEKVSGALAALNKYWDELLSTYTLTSKDEKLNRMVNVWNPYQCMVTFNMSRSASYFETGIGRGMGFRDSNQDLLGFVHLIPERARERILDIAATQFPDGSAYHQYQPLTKRGNHDLGSGFNDDPLWLILGTAAYIKETGDFRDPRRAGSLQQRREQQGVALRAPEAFVPLRAEQPRPARLAAHRSRRLERLPEPELLLRNARREVPDDRKPHGQDGRERLHRGHVRAHRPRVRRALPSVAGKRTRRKKRASSSRR